MLKASSDGDESNILKFDNLFGGDVYFGDNVGVGGGAQEKDKVTKVLQSFPKKNLLALKIEILNLVEQEIELNCRDPI